LTSLFYWEGKTNPIGQENTVGFKLYTDWASLEAVVEKLTAGHMRNLDWVKKFRHAETLLKSCNDAYDELSSSLYVGLGSHSAVMHRAMEIFKQRYGRNVPTPWLPTIRALDTASAESWVEIQSLRRPHPAPELFTHHLSILAWSRFPSIHSEVAQKECIALAEEKGVPCNVSEGIAFLTEALPRLASRGIELTEVETTLRAMIEHNEPGAEVISTANAVQKTDCRQ
jgi:hypothetical protein